MSCTYKITGSDGKVVTLTGKNAMKAYLAEGGMQELLPGWGSQVSKSDASEPATSDASPMQEPAAAAEPTTPPATEETAAKQASPKSVVTKAKAAKDAKIAAAKEALGADVGDFVVLNRDHDYLKAGDRYQIESISNAGQVYFRRPETGSGTYLTVPQLITAKRQGVTFTKQQAEAAAAPESPAASGSKTPTMDAHVDLMARVRNGEATADQMRESFARLDAGREALAAELNTMNKERLLRSGGFTFYQRHRDSKKAEVVDALVRAVLDEYSLGRSYGPSSYVLSAAGMEAHRKAQAAALRELVANLTDADIAAHAKEVAESRAEVKARREAAQQTLENPQTLDDFRTVISHYMEKFGDTNHEAYLRLTPDQRQRHDELGAEASKAMRESAKAKLRAQVATAGQKTTGEVIATKHTKHGHDLFVVQLAERVSRDDYETLNASAKRMGGSYSSYRGNGAVPGFQFRTREAAEAFGKLVAGDTADAQAVAQARRDAFEDDRSQSAAERLRNMAMALEDRADEQLGRERKVNTARRARFAASAEGAARADKAMAGTMNNLAAAIEAGKAKFLDAVRQKVQVETLSQYLRSAKDAQIRAKYSSYAEQERHRGDPIDAETVDYAAFPTYSAMRSDLASIARQMLEVDGFKKMGQRLMSVADDVSEAYTTWAKENQVSVSRYMRGDQLADFPSREAAERAIRRSGLTGKAIVLPIKRGQNRIVLAPSEAMKLGLWSGDGDKRITLSSDFGREMVEALGRRAGGKIKLPWSLESTFDKRKRLEGMGIYTAPEFRSALREFAGIQEVIASPNKIKEMERAMVGRRNDGLDFFPTSDATTDAVLDAADIQEGMSVAEPSAGMGHMADRIRERTGIWPDVAELSPERRELLEAKGYNVVGHDFMAMDPRKSFTYGDVFRHTDGTFGVMRGSGGMGSDRVGFHPLDAEGNPDARAARWVDREDLTGVERRGADSGYDRIIMNPPFSKGRDIQHVRHAYEFLRPGGRLVAIMGEGAFFHSNQAAENFREWLDSLGATAEKLPEGSFMDPSLPVNTAANARMVVIDKPTAEVAPKPEQAGTADSVLFSFAGRKAQGADLHALNTAQQRLARGEDAEAVRRDTGWHRGADGKWRFEISDHQARIAVGGVTAGDVIDLARVAAMADGRNQVTVGDLLEHDRLFAAYPHLADIPVSVMPAGERSTAKLRSRGGKLTMEVKADVPRAELPSVLMHELQHGIQLKEGFALGGTAKPLAGGAVSALDQAGAITYKRLAGEVEARNTQARMNMSPRARMDIAPEESADIPASQVLVTFNGRDLADLPGPRNAAGAPMTERALVRAIDRQFPNLGKALRTMLARGRAGKRGGVVLLDDADPLNIARAFTSKTGTALSKSVQLFSDAGQVNGFFDPKSGLTFLVGPNLNPVTGPAVLLHEMSHGQQREALDRRALEMLTTRGRVKNANLRAFLDRVAARMNSVGETGNAAEATAYIVEQAVMEGRSQGFAVADSRFLDWIDQNLGQRVGDFLRSVLAMVRSFMLRHGMGVGDVTVDDLVGYAMVGMERAARGDVGGVEPAFSRSAMKSVEANIARGQEAMTRAINERNSVHRAMFRNGLGWVDFVWGDQNKGIAHILARRMTADGMSRTEVVRMLTDDLVEAIARGADIRRREVGGSVRAVVAFNNHEVVLVRNPGANSWMLSGWKVSPGAAAAANDTSRATHRAADSSDDTMGAGGENHTGAEVGSATQSSATQDAPIRSRGALGAGNPIVDQDGDMNNTPGIKFSRSGLREVASRATAELDKTFSAPGGLSWWHKTVGTMYNLAQRSPAFKPVFEAAQGFVDDVSHYANDAADLAPKLLPKLDGWRDIMKAPVSAEDNKAVAGPVFEGTLSWTRGEDGKPVRVDDAAAEAARMTTEQKAEALRRRDKLPEGMLRAWKALPGDQFAKMIDSRYESQLLKPGLVWTDAELRDMFKLNDGQVALYREFRAAVDRSLDTMARADMLRFGGEDVKSLRQQVMDAPSAQDAALLLRDHLADTADAWPGRATDLLNVANGIMERAEKVTQLQAEGYAPLSRFGKYSVDVVDQGERQYFGLFETKREANQMAERMRAAFPGAEVSQGTMSEEAYKLFAGVTPETLELFGNALGFNSTGDSAQDRAFQQYLRLTKTNRSAMKRLIHRQGIAGYSEDVGRVLAAFVYSNARQTAAGLNLGDLTEAVDAIPKEQGELKDAAVRLAEYIKNPQEEAQAVRGLLFAQYLGGSIASAFVNMTQPIAVTFPWLSQYGGAKKAAAEIGRAAKEMAAKGHQYEPDLAQALHEAEEDGTVSPQEVHQLMAQAQGRGSLRSGDGTKQGDALASASNGLKRLAFAWGKVFGLAEQANRRVTFIAAYRMGKEQGMADPAGFARQAVKETQFVYSKASKMQWGRGAVGGTLMTFKTYSIAYLELLHRMYTQGGPEGKRAALLALGVLMLMGGAGGLPFADDAADAADALAQLLGYNISTKAARQELLEQVFGRGLAGFIEKGVTGLPGAPIDVSGRLGLGNLIPGTGLLQSKTSHTSDVLEIVGPAGDFAKRIGEGAAQLLHGNVAGGLLTMAPQAVRNAAKGADMAATGMYRDAKGYKVLDTNPLEAAAKAIGFQPQSVARIQEANAEAQQAKNFYNLRAQEIRAKWAQGIFENDPGKVQEAREEIADWNAKNPDQRMLITVPSVMKRVKEMRKSKDQRIADTAPKAMRAQIRADLAQAREAP